MNGSSAQSRRTPWLVAVVLVLLLLGVAGVIAYVSTEPGPPDGGPVAGSPPPTSSGSQGRYGPAPDLCEMSDVFAPVFDVLPPTDLRADQEYPDEVLYQRDCVFDVSDGESGGIFSIHIGIDNSVEAAENRFRQLSEAAAGPSSQLRDLDGDWDEGVVVGQETDRSGDVQLLARDGVLVVDLKLYVLGDASDTEAQQVMLAQAADNVRGALRR